MHLNAGENRERVRWRDSPPVVEIEAMPERRLLICPYCGETQPESDRCRACAGLFEPLSRQATHNSMGPWFIRNEQRPHQPGCSYETLLRLIQRGRVTRHTIVRGPTTRQFWTIAKRVPGISHLFGACYQCDASVDPDDRSCHGCGATFGGFLDRNFLGLPEYRPMPWEDDRTAHRRPAVEPGEPSDWRQHNTSACGGPRGISSFATDDELLGEAAADSGSGEPSSNEDHDLQGEQQTAAQAIGLIESQSGEQAERTRLAASQPQSRAGGAAMTTELDPIAQSVRRRVVKQQKTIRLLSYTCIGLFALMFVMMLLLLDTRPVGSAGEDDAAVATQQSSGLPVEHHREIQQEQDARDSEQDIVREEQLTRAESMQESHRLMYQEATTLIERASESERALAERILDLERAVAAMERLKREVAEAALPEDFADTLQAARRTLERLRMREFFP